MTEDVEALLNQLKSQREDPQRALDDIRSRSRALRADFARLVRNDPDGLPPRIVEALLAQSGPDASIEFQGVRRRVEDGHFTWAELYADPEGTAGPEGRALVRRAVHGGVGTPRADGPVTAAEASPAPPAGRPTEGGGPQPTQRT